MESTPRQVPLGGRGPAHHGIPGLLLLGLLLITLPCGVVLGVL